MLPRQLRVKRLRSDVMCKESLAAQTRVPSNACKYTQLDTFEINDHRFQQHHAMDASNCVLQLLCLKMSQNQRSIQVSSESDFEDKGRPKVVLF